MDLDKFWNTKKALEDVRVVKGENLKIEAFEMCASNPGPGKGIGAPLKFRDANYSAGSDGRLLWMGNPVDVDGIPVFVTRWEF